MEDDTIVDAGVEAFLGKIEDMPKKTRPAFLDLCCPPKCGNYWVLQNDKEMFSLEVSQNRALAWCCLPIAVPCCWLPSLCCCNHASIDRYFLLPDNALIVDRRYFFCTSRTQYRFRRAVHVRQGQNTFVRINCEQNKHMTLTLGAYKEDQPLKQRMTDLFNRKDRKENPKSKPKKIGENPVALMEVNIELRPINPTVLAHMVPAKSLPAELNLLQVVQGDYDFIECSICCGSGSEPTYIPDASPSCVEAMGGSLLVRMASDNSIASLKSDDEQAATTAPAAGPKNIFAADPPSLGGSSSSSLLMREGLGDHPSSGLLKESTWLYAVMKSSGDKATAKEGSAKGEIKGGGAKKMQVLDAQTSRVLEEAFWSGAGAVVHVKTPADELVFDLDKMQMTSVLREGVTTSIRRVAESSDQRYGRYRRAREALELQAEQREAKEDEAGDSKMFVMQRGESMGDLLGSATQKATTSWLMGDSKGQWVLLPKGTAALLEDGYQVARSSEKLSINTQRSREQMKLTMGFVEILFDLTDELRMTFLVVQNSKSKRFRLKSGPLRRLGGAELTQGQLQLLRRSVLNSATPSEGVRAQVVFAADDAYGRSQLVSPNSAATPGDSEPAEGSGAQAPRGACLACKGTGKTSRHLTSKQAARAAAQEGKAAEAEEEQEALDCCVCWGDGTFCLSSDQKCRHFYCSDCIRGTLKAAVETGNFPIQCPSCKASALDRPEKGRESQVQGLLNIGALLFLEQRGVIQKALFYRLIRSSAQAGVPLLKEGGGVALGELLKKGERKAKSAGHSEKEAEDVISSWLPCPAVGCNRTLLTLHPKYKDLGLGAFFDNVKEHQTCVRLGVCPCGALLCPRCKQLVKPAEARSHMCKTARKAVDVEEEKKTMAVMRKVCKRCPGCGNFVQKTQGCHIMMCGTNAHGKVRDALRNGGCACIFDWNTLKPCNDGHGYTNMNGKWVKGKGPKTAKQVLLYGTKNPNSTQIKPSQPSAQVKAATSAKPQQVRQKKAKAGLQWGCRTCTFLNAFGMIECEMCGSKM